MPAPSGPQRPRRQAVTHKDQDGQGEVAHPATGETAPQCRLRALQAVAGVRIARMHPHMLRHTFVTTMLDAGVDLRDTQIAARHADPRTTMRYDRARNNLDRHPNYILAAYGVY
ncbi:MAG TPA: site-specific integrase [Jatrophihabitantaceae bacterium]